MSIPVNINDRLEAAAFKAESGADILRRVANDPVGSSIPTESGLLPSIAEWFATIGGGIGTFPARLEDLEEYFAALFNPGMGAAKIARATVALASVHDLLAVFQDAGLGYMVASFHSSPTPGVFALVEPFGSSGGGHFRWVPGLPRSSHNGMYIISPTVPWDGAQETLGDFLSGSGETAPGGSGCFVRSGGKLCITHAGARPVAGVDNNPSLLHSFIVAHEKNIKLHGPAGEFEYAGVFDIGFPGLDFECAGALATIFKCTTPGVACAALGNRPNRNAFSIYHSLGKFTIEGNANTSKLFQYRINFSHLYDINVREGAPGYGIGFSWEGAVSVYMERLSCSENINSMTNVPYRGMVFDVDPDDPEGPRRASNNCLVAPKVDGVWENGITLINADNTEIYIPAVQGNEGIGISIGANCHCSSIYGGGFENKGFADVFDDGIDTKVFNSYGTKGCVAGPNSEKSLFWGGRWQNVTAADTANRPTFIGVTYNWLSVVPTGVLDITSCPTFRFRDIKNGLAGTYVRPTTSPVVQTVGASPWIYTNTSGLNQRAYLSSGGTTLTLRQAGGDLYTIGIPAGGGLVPMPDGDGLKLAYSTPPFVSVFTDHSI